MPSDVDEFLTLLRHRHAAITEARPDKNPGASKTMTNRAGNTVFVVPDLVAEDGEKFSDRRRRAATDAEFKTSVSAD